MVVLNQSGVHQFEINTKRIALSKLYGNFNYLCLDKRPNAKRNRWIVSVIIGTSLALAGVGVAIGLLTVCKVLKLFYLKTIGIYFVIRHTCSKHKVFN